MSNKYYRNWMETESSVSNDSKRLDRLLDKIKTEEKAKKIFSQSYNPKYQKECKVCLMTQPRYLQPVLVSNIGTEFVVINGCLVIRKKNFF